jgi:hypothetical protein
MNLRDLIQRYPRLYHMAEAGTWPKIKADGLLSTSAVLDRYKVEGDARIAIESRHRPTKVAVGIPGDEIVIRDQIPMEPSRLAKGLLDGITPEAWYKQLNGMVFMWAQEHRLFGLLGARQYRLLPHDVLTIDTASLLTAHSKSIWLCPMNSGNTFPIPHFRGKDTFRRIEDYPVKSKGGAPAKEVVEVVADYSIADIAKYVVQVRRIQGETILGEFSL